MYIVNSLSSRHWVVMFHVNPSHKTVNFLNFTSVQSESLIRLKLTYLFVESFERRSDILITKNLENGKFI